MNEAQAKNLADAEEVLAEKNRLEEAVRRQHELIEKQAGELRLLKSQIRERDEALDRARATIDELQLRAAGGSALKILFGEARGGTERRGGEGPPADPPPLPHTPAFLQAPQRSNLTALEPST